MGPFLQTLLELTPRNVDEVLQYVVGRLGSIFCLTVAVSSHHVPEAGSQVDEAYNLAVNIHVVGIVIGFFAAFPELCLKL